MGTLARTLVGIGIILTGLLGGAASGAPPAPSPVQPNQSFIGLVNGHTGSAVIEVLCPGPLHLNQTGNPLTGQTLAVASPSTSDALVGDTGARGHSIVALFTPTSTVGAQIRWTFTDYGSQPIPASLQLPCNGTSTLLFSPRPRSMTSTPTKVAITFEATCGSPVCPVGGRRGPRPI
jgi:hypothetical protein